uniref:Uncharacterized protein n=1 Tax=Molossus molossus TaxID=27622 RepID=A0A7J8CS77_MOLMO|nr:hypothetical protein HJG59_009788 [Molossus molossus]
MTWSGEWKRKMATWKTVSKCSWVGADGGGLASGSPLGRLQVRTLRGWRKWGQSFGPDPYISIQTLSRTRLKPGTLLISLTFVLSGTRGVFFTNILGKRKRIHLHLQNHFLFQNVPCSIQGFYSDHLMPPLSGVSMCRARIVHLRSQSAPTPHPFKFP